MNLMADTKKPAAPNPEILAARKERLKANQDEAKKLARHRRRLKERLKDDRDWPLQVDNYGHIDRAKIDHEDVRAPLPEDLRQPTGKVDDKMQLLRKFADQEESFDGDTVPVDPGVLSRRRREREQELERRARVMGEAWSPELVEARLEEAYRTLFRASVGGVGPREFGSAMPQVIRSMSDLVAQAGNKSLRNAIAHRFKSGLPSTDEMRRAEEALSWSLRYLRDDHPDYAGFLNLGAMWRAWGAPIAKKCRDIGVHRQVFYRDRKEAVKLIVEGLKKDGKAPT